jgi:voltage-gated potassium channel
MTWKDDLNYGLAAFGVQIPDRVSPSDWAEKLAENPTENTAYVVAASSVLFYLVERGYNSKVNDVWDAAVYCSTCLSVGYGDIFAKTPLGKLIGTTLMSIGPALAGATLDGKSAARKDQLQQEILKTLQTILARLPETPAPAAT